MKMKINDRVLSIPPYISTSWENIASISVKEKELKLYLIIELKNEHTIEIPDLSSSVLDAIFDMHTKYLESSDPKGTLNTPSAPNESLGFGFPIKIGMEGGTGLESLGAAMQHNPDQMNAPNLPKEVLQRIISIAKVIGMDDPHNIPKPEPHCNCIHCQIARSLQVGAGMQEENLDEEVNEEDLKFRSWDIKQTNEHLYEVINPLDTKEKYNVFLGDPIGCTCGERNCEHIKAVLNS